MEQIMIKEITVESPEYLQVQQIREEILRAPLGLSLKDEDLSGEKNEMILAAMKMDQVVGCILLQPINDMTIRFRQMAVAQEEQQQGIGSQLLEEAEKAAWKAGFERIVLHARKTAVGFYEHAGYTVEGDEFEEVGIPHLFMEKHKPV